ncbi:MAG: hypothetical protein AAFX05_13365 [Planctomycetota bacterium]
MRLLVAVGLLGLGLIGCSGPKDFDNENDALRRERESLELENVQLRARLAESEAKLAEMARTFEAAGGRPGADVVASMPRCAGIAMDRFSGPADRDDIDGPELIDVYIRPFDGRMRFVQVAGQLTVEAVLIPPTDRGEEDFGGPRSLGRVELGPVDLREAYRSSAMGTHYAVVVPISPPNQPLSGTLVLTALLQDAITGRAHEARATMSIDIP